MRFLAKKQTIALIFILLLASYIRLYRSYDLAVFLSDQASDSLAVLNMLRGHFTLLGPITSVGGFFNGPIVYYLMLPFYALFRGNPYAGTFFQLCYSIATIPFIYLLGKQLKNERVGLVASFLFAISPLMVDYSRAAFNSYPAVFFSTVSMYFFITLLKSFSYKRTFLLGILLGMIMQMHYLALSIVLAILIYPLIFHTFNKSLFNPRYYVTVLFGIVVGFSPFLLFEARHQFLNIHLFFTYLFSPRASSRSAMYALRIWPDVMGRLMLGNSIWLGALGVFMSIYMVLRKRETLKKNSTFLFIALLFVIVTLINFIYGRELQTHYVVVFHTSLILIFSLTLCELVKNNVTVLKLLALGLLILNAFHWNFQYIHHPLQQGLGIEDFKYASSIIAGDKKGRYNVAMHTQGDNRAMPLRYMLTLRGEDPINYTDYAGSKTLYLLLKKIEQPNQLKMWEYTSFGKATIVKRWNVNYAYHLYKLTKE